MIPDFVRTQSFVHITHIILGFDNDDGSSWYHIHDNFIYGEGLKQDYGGHNSIYNDNVNIVHKYDGQNCFNTWKFVPKGNNLPHLSPLYMYIQLLVTKNNL